MTISFEDFLQRCSSCFTAEYDVTVQQMSPAPAEPMDLSVLDWEPDHGVKVHPILAWCIADVTWRGTVNTCDDEVTDMTPPMQHCQTWLPVALEVDLTPTAWVPLRGDTFAAVCLRCNTALRKAQLEATELRPKTENHFPPVYETQEEVDAYERGCSDTEHRRAYDAKFATE